MSSSPEIALAASARDWPDRLHRFLLDHGGGVVRARVMSPDQALIDEYEVLLIDDVCSFLTPRLVLRLRELGRELIGVFDSEDGTDAKRRLLECGITDVVESRASPEEFLQGVEALIEHRGPEGPRARSKPPQSFLLGVTGAGRGTGVTEVAISLAESLSMTHRTVLVDGDQEMPGVAQRLGLAPHPNLRTAVDHAHHDPGRLLEAVQSLDRLDVVVGLAGAHNDAVLPIPDVASLLDELGRHQFQVIVVDLGRWSGGWKTSLLSPFDALVVVGTATPLGLTRLVHQVEALATVGAREVVPLVNRVPRSGRRTDDIRIELSKSLPGHPLILIPDDGRLERAAWDGAIQLSGPFARSIQRVGLVLSESLGS